MIPPVPYDMEPLCLMHLTCPRVSGKDALQSTESSNQLTLSTSPSFPSQFNFSLVLVAPAPATPNLHCTQTLSCCNPSSPAGQDVNHRHRERESLVTRLMESPEGRWDGEMVHRMTLKIQLPSIS